MKRKQSHSINIRKPLENLSKTNPNYKSEKNLNRKESSAEESGEDEGKETGVGIF